MSTMVAISLDSEEKAFKLRALLTEVQTDYLLELEDVVVVTRKDNGKPKLHQAINLTAAGAVGGSFWGMLVGLLFLNPLVGAAVGAGSGAISGALSDIGIEDDFMKQAAESLQSDDAMLFALVRNGTADKVLDRLRGFGGTVVTSSLSKDREEQLQAVLSTPAVIAEMKVQDAALSGGEKKAELSEA